VSSVAPRKHCRCPKRRRKNRCHCPTDNTVEPVLPSDEEEEEEEEGAHEQAEGRMSEQQAFTWVERTVDSQRTHST
jgi:hypothetical protein